MAEVVSLAAARQRKLARESAAAQPRTATLRPLGVADLRAEFGLVVMVVPHSHGEAEVPFTPNQARIWGERLLMLADSAEAEGRRG